MRGASINFQKKKKYAPLSGGFPSRGRGKSRDSRKKKERGPSTGPSEEGRFTSTAKIRKKRRSRGGKKRFPERQKQTNLRRKGEGGF